MTGWRPDDEFDEDPWNDDRDAWAEDDRDAPQERDVVDEDEDETPTVPCPSCRREVPDFADRCPYCGEWITQASGAGGRPAWILIGAILALLAFLAWAVL